MLEWRLRRYRHSNGGVAGQRGHGATILMCRRHSNWVSIDRIQTYEAVVKLASDFLSTIGIRVGSAVAW